METPSVLLPLELVYTSLSPPLLSSPSLLPFSPPLLSSPSLLPFSPPSLTPLSSPLSSSLSPPLSSLPCVFPAQHYVVPWLNARIEQSAHLEEISSSMRQLQTNIDTTSKNTIAVLTQSTSAVYTNYPFMALCYSYIYSTHTINICCIY